MKTWKQDLIIGFYFFSQITRNASVVQFAVGCFANVFVASGNLIKDTVVHGRDKHIIGSPCLIMKILNGLVIP